MRPAPILLLVTLTILPALAGAQEAAETPAATQAEAAPPAAGLEVRLFFVEHRDPRAVFNAIRLLGSGALGAAIDRDPQMHTITARDYPENLAAMEAAIRRLDVPTPPSPGIALRLYVLLGGGSPAPGATLPAELEDVVPELAATLRYSSYALLTSALHRTAVGDGIQGSGVADSEAVGYETPPGAPLVYSYQLRRIELVPGAEPPAVAVGELEFSMRMPVSIRPDQWQYSDVGFETPVTIREGEKVVVGTTAMGERALIVVVTVDVEDRAGG